jgi:uncharacterized protein (TIGR02145 family)
MTFAKNLTVFHTIDYMHRFLSSFVFLFVLICQLAFFFSCKKDNNEKPSDSGTNFWGNSISLTISGKVEDAAGNALGGAVVKAGNLSVTTDNNGIFILKNAPGNSSLAFVQVEKAGYFPGSRSFLPTAGGGNLRIRLLSKTLTGTLSSSVGGTVNHSSGAQVMLESGSVTKNGAAYSGNVKVFIQSIDPTTSDFESRMPGNLIAMDGNAARGLRSFGMLAVELQDEAGQELQIASGKKAHIKFPIPAGLVAQATDSIDLWSYDEAKGYWKKEGRAGREGNFYHAMVGHFSFWNCDAPFPLIELKGRILFNEAPLANAIVTITSPGMGTRSTATNGEGRFGGFVPKDEVLSMQVSVQCGSGTTQVYNESRGPFSTHTQLQDEQIGIPNVTTISGKVSGCNNAAISGAYVVAGGQAYFTDASGNYTLSACGSNLILTAYGSNPWAQGSSQTVSLSGGNTTVNLEVCNSGGTGNTVTDIDGNVYNTVTIGTQVWMKENLKVSKYKNGDVIPTNLDSAAWYTTPSGAFAIYNNDAANNTIYGKLYNWYAVADPRGLCPTGWHVPSDAEWTTLENFLGGRSVAGGKMKAVSSLWQSPNTGATNESGFSGLPGGSRGYHGPYLNVGTYGLWWSSTEVSSANAWFRTLYYYSGISDRYYSGKQGGFSVRCLRD